jgi:parallel beta-helix repeat protein
MRSLRSILFIALFALPAIGLAEAQPPTCKPRGHWACPSPSPCRGVQVTAPASVQAAVDANPAGTTFCLSGTFVLSGSGVLSKSGNTYIGPATLDGDDVGERGIYGFGGPTGQSNVTIRGLLFEDFTVGAVKAGWGWFVEDSEMRSSTIGIETNTNGVFRRNHIHHNAMYGITGGPASDMLFESNELAFNGGTSDGGGSTGGSKIVGSSAGDFRTTFRGNYVHDNSGPGLWVDGNGHDTLYEANTVVFNRGPGIFHEISWNAVIRDNIVHDNSLEAAGKSCWWGSQIHLNNSQDVEIYGNTVEGGTGENGICLVSSTRDEPSNFPQTLANVSVHDNTITMGGTDETGAVGTVSDGIVFARNTYLADPAGLHWAWFDRYPLTWAEWQARGMDLTGSAS